jgi:hypothetical protein
LWLAFRDLLRKVAQRVQLGGDRLHGGEDVIRVALLPEQLASHFGGAQPRIETCRAKLGGRLTLAIDNRSDITEQVGKMSFGAFAPPGGEGIETPKAAFQLMRAFADEAPVPAELPFGIALTAWTDFFDGSRHKQTARAAFEGLSGLDEQGLESVSELHSSSSSM